MGFRFRKSLKLAPGIKINLGKRGASLSLGGRGATVNISSKGTRTTLGIPGTGISHASYSKHERKDSKRSSENAGEDLLAGVLTIIGLIIFLGWLFS